jgi:hypothetical protein
LSTLDRDDDPRPVSVPVLPLRPLLGVEVPAPVDDPPPEDPPGDVLRPV